MTENVIIVFILCATVAAYEPVVLKGFHFNSDRMAHYPISVHDMGHHIGNPNSDWMYDFQNHGNCLRINVKPFTLPMSWTVCYKSNHDYVDNFVFLSLISSKSGNSVVDDFKNTT